MQIEKFEIMALAALIVLAGFLSHIGFSSLLGSYIIHSSGSISFSVTSPLHAEGKWIKDQSGNIVYLRGGWRCSPGFEDTTVGMFPFEGEERGWADEVVPYTYRPDAVEEWLGYVRQWGFNSIASMVNIDWWIVDSRTCSTFPRDEVWTDTPYRDAYMDFLDRAYQHGIYVQVRLYTVDAQEGKVPWMFPLEPYGYSSGYAHNGEIFPGWYDGNHPAVYSGPPLDGMESFGQFCYDWAFDLFSARSHHYPNVLLAFFDDVDPWPAPDSMWFQTFDLALRRVREAEQAVGSDSHLLVNHYLYCGDLQWVNAYMTETNALTGEDYRSDNVVFSSHIYRVHETFDLMPGGRPNANTPYEDIRDFIGYSRASGSQYSEYGLAYREIMDTYDVPVHVTAIGAERGWLTTNYGEAEYQTFVKSLQALNEFGIGYWAYCWPQDNSDPPQVTFRLSSNYYSRSPDYANRVGLALTDAIAAGET